MNLNELISSLRNLPPAPRVMPKLLAFLNDPEASTTDIIDLIELDASLTAKIIGTSNSAFYGFEGGITDLGDAVNRLGFREIYRIVTHIFTRSFVGQSMESYQIDSEERWFNSVATGLVMEVSSNWLKLGDPATSYTIGLLHDIGKIAINQVFYSNYQPVLDRVESEKIELRIAEKMVFGFDHAEAGAALLGSWDFPLEIIEPIEFQYEPAKANNYSTYASLLHLSRWIAASIGGAPGKHARAFKFHEDVLESLSIEPEIVMQLMIESKDQLKRKEALLS